MWDRSLFKGAQMESAMPAFFPRDFIDRTTIETGAPLFTAIFVVAVFYQTDFDKSVHYTASMHEVGGLNQHGGMRGIPFTHGTVPANQLAITNFNGLIVAS
jgi:hypothetical protein